MACEIAAITIANPALVMLPALLTDTAAALPTPSTMDSALILPLEILPVLDTITDPELPFPPTNELALIPLLKPPLCD
ncbi:MAG: hypothetical protein ABWY82_13240, partial [Tardiphaga sp.]